jgi:hypothetical protein
VLVVIVAVFLGAGVGALARPTPTRPYVADAVIAIQPDVPPSPGELELQRARWQRAAQSLTLPQVISEVIAVSHVSITPTDVRSRLSARGRPETGLFVIRARAENEKFALLFAAAASRSVIDFLRVSTGNPGSGTPRTAFDFEDGAQAWGAARSEFLLAPVSSAPAAGGARFGRGFLRVTCLARRAGCGASVLIGRGFSPGKVYTAAAWVRSRGALAPLRLVLGASPTDVATGRTVRVSTNWTRLSAAWAPRALVGGAELGVQVNGGVPASFDVDQASVLGPGGRLPGPTATDLPDRYTIVGSAAPSGKLRAGTGTSALIGGAIGLAAGIGGVGLGRLTRRRQALPAAGGLSGRGRSSGV